MKKYFLSFILLIICLNVCSSDSYTYLDDFSWIKSEGEMPEELKSFAISKKEEDKYLKDLVVNGRIIYGSELNKYIEKIAGDLLKNDPALRSKLRFYVVKSPAVNASMTRQGIVLVNLGLLAQVNNESELAFVIGHEIIHYTEGHVYANNKSKKKVFDIEEYLTYHQTSRDREVEADRLSLERYYINSSYSLEALTNFFDVLRYSYLPFDEIAFTRKEVETDFYQFPENYFQTSVNTIRSRTDNVDTLSTHPNIYKRQQYLESVIIKNPDKGKEFVQKESDFYKVKNLARFECINYYLTRHKYDDAIYNIYVLQQQFPDNKFLESALASAYYGFYKHKLNGGTTEVIDRHREVEGQKQQVSYFLSKLTRAESNVLALRVIKKVYEKYSDSYLERLYDDAIADMIEVSKLSLSDFSDFPANVNPDSILKEPQQEDNASSKYDRIKLQEAQSRLISPSDKFKTVNYMLVDIKKESDFVKRYESTYHSIEDAKVLNLIDTSDKKVSINKDEKLLIWFPYYRKYKNQVVYKTSAFSEKTMSNTIKKSVKKLDVNYEIWDESKFQSFNTDVYNFYTVVQQWNLEYNHVSFSMNLYQQQWAQPALEQKGFSYVNFLHAYSIRDYDGYKKYVTLLLSLGFPFALPMNLPDLLLIDKGDNLLFYLVDVRDGSTAYFSRSSINGIMNKAYINSALYDSYFNCLK